MRIALVACSFAVAIGAPTPLLPAEEPDKEATANQQKLQGVIKRLQKLHEAKTAGTEVQTPEEEEEARTWQKVGGLIKQQEKQLHGPNGKPDMEAARGLGQKVQGVIQQLEKAKRRESLEWLPEEKAVEVGEDARAAATPDEDVYFHALDLLKQVFHVAGQAELHQQMGGVNSQMFGASDTDSVPARELVYGELANKSFLRMFHLLKVRDAARSNSTT